MARQAGREKMTMKHPVPDNAVHPLTGLPLRYFLAAEIVADLPPYGGAFLLDGTLHCRKDQYLRYRRWQSEALNEYMSGRNTQEVTP